MTDQEGYDPQLPEYRGPRGEELRLIDIDLNHYGRRLKKLDQVQADDPEFDALHRERDEVERHLLELGRRRREIERFQAADKKVTRSCKAHAYANRRGEVRIQAHIPLVDAVAITKGEGTDLPTVLRDVLREVRHDYPEAWAELTNQPEPVDPATRIHRYTGPKQPAPKRKSNSLHQRETDIDRKMDELSRRAAEDAEKLDSVMEPLGERGPEPSFVMRVHRVLDALEEEMGEDRSRSPYRKGRR